eukprot:364690-Chlamydomonas_euryale.AAC.13
MGLKLDGWIAAGPRTFSALSSMTLRTSAVSTNSGHTQCSATLYGGRASTTAWLRTKLSTPALLAAYAGAAGIGKKAPAEATARMVPPRPCALATPRPTWMVFGTGHTEFGRGKHPRTHGLFEPCTLARFSHAGMQTAKKYMYASRYRSAHA